MVQPGRPWGWRRRPPAGPGIEADVVMVAAGREEHGIAAVAGRDVEAEHVAIERNGAVEIGHRQMNVDRKSTRLNSSHDQISYAVFCLKKKKNTKWQTHCIHEAPHVVEPPGCPRMCFTLGPLL